VTFPGPPNRDSLSLLLFGLRNDLAPNLLVIFHHIDWGADELGDIEAGGLQVEGEVF
jgi:hypothetical protein